MDSRCWRRSVFQFNRLVDPRFQWPFLPRNFNEIRRNFNKIQRNFNEIPTKKLIHRNLISVILIAECLKLIICLVIVFFEEGRSVRKFGTALRKTIIENEIDTLKVCGLSFLYAIQNNLLYVGLSNLDPEIFLVCIWLYYYQMHLGKHID